MALVASCAVSAQAQLVPITGRVLDPSNAPLTAARVSVVGSYLAASTDSVGQFRLRVPHGDLVLEVRRIGFTAARVPVRASADSAIGEIVVRLSPLPIVMGGVLIPGERVAALGQMASRSTIRNAPPLGEPDIIRAMAILPGVAQPNEFVPRLHLAGAAGDETMITLDGHPMQFPSHLSGFVGSLNVAAVDGADLLMHHVPAATDSRLGGTLALRSRESVERVEGEIALSLLAASATVSAPTGLHDGSVMLSGRYSYLAWLLQQAYGATATDLPGNYYGDALLRIRQGIGRSWRVDLLGYETHDWVDVSTQPLARGYSTGESLVGVTAVREGLYTRFTARASHDLGFAVRAGPSGTVDRDLRLEQRWTTVSATLDRVFSPMASGTFAISFDEHRHRHRWDFELGDGVAQALPRRFRAASEQRLGAAAVEVRILPKPIWSTAFGVRTTSNGGSTVLAPRWATTLKVLPTLQLEAALDRRYQFDTQVGDPDNSFLPSPTFLLERPRRVDAVATTLEWTPTLQPQRSFVGSATLFARSYADRTEALARPFDTTLATAVAFRRVPAQSIGMALGVTFATAGGLTLQSAYTYARVVQRDSSGWHPTDWATPHTLATLLALPLGERWQFTTTMQIRSGPAVTPIVGQLLVPTPEVPGSFWPRLMYGERNSATLGTFRRMDVALRRRWLMRGADVSLAFQVVNVLGNTNVREYDWYQFLEQRRLGSPTYPQRRGLKIVPSLGLQVRW